MKTKELANELELKILAYLQDFIGFQRWWDELTIHEQSQIEDGMLEGIARHLSNEQSLKTDGLKKCGYCGYENFEEDSHCHQCSEKFNPPTA